MSEVDKTPRLIVVEIFNDARSSAEAVAREIVGNLEDVKSAYPAYDNGWGHIVKSGTEVEA